MHVHDGRLCIDSWSVCYQWWYVALLGLLVAVGCVVGLRRWLRVAACFVVIPIVGGIWASSTSMPDSDVNFEAIAIFGAAVEATLSLYVGVALGLLARAAVRHRPRKLG